MLKMKYKKGYIINKTNTGKKMSDLFHEEHKIIKPIDQGSKGIRQWPISRCASPMIKHQITLSVDYNCRPN